MATSFCPFPRIFPAGQGLTGIPCLIRSLGMKPRKGSTFLWLNGTQKNPVDQGEFAFRLLDSPANTGEPRSNTFR